MASQAGLREASQVTWQVARFTVGTGIGVGAAVDVCLVTECDVGDVGGVVTLFPSPSSGYDLPSGVATPSRVTGDRRRHWAIRQRWPRLYTSLPCGERHSRPTSQVDRLESSQCPARWHDPSGRRDGVVPGGIAGAGCVGGVVAVAVAGGLLSSSHSPQKTDNEE